MTALAAVPWSRIAGIVFFSLFLTALSRLFIDESTRGILRASVLAGAALLVEGRYAAGFAGGWGRWRAARAAGKGVLHGVLALQPVEVFGLQRHVLGLLTGFARWITRRRPPALPEGLAFGYLGKSSYPAAAIVLALCLIVELPVGYLLMKAFGMPAAKLAAVHDALLVLTIWIFVLGLGDRYWLRAGAHVLDARALHLRLGTRVTGALPLSLIDRAIPLARRTARQPAASPGQALTISPLDAPNLRLMVAAGALTGLRVRGAPVASGVTALDLRVDDPAGLLAALAARGVPVA